MNHLPLLIRREFWEHRAFLIAPAVVAVIMLLGAIFGHADFGTLPAEFLNRPDLLAKRSTVITTILGALTFPYFVVMGMVLSFYLLDSLYADRKDRSVLFWKSLPVSDLSTVLSKLVTAAVVLPLFTFGVAVVSNLLFGLIESIRLSGAGHNAWQLIWGPRAWFSAHGILLYGLVAAMLWYLPIIGWMLFISAWARRHVILWASLPPVLLLVLEKVLFDTTHISDLLHDRSVGWFWLAFQRGAPGANEIVVDGERIPWPTQIGEMLDPAGFLASPGLWLGLVAAGLLVWAAVVARRHRSEV